MIFNFEMHDLINTLFLLISMLFENMSRLENISELIKMSRQKYLNRNNSEKPIHFNYHFNLRLFNYESIQFPSSFEMHKQQISQLLMYLE